MKEKKNRQKFEHNLPRPTGTPPPHAEHYCQQLHTYYVPTYIPYNPVPTLIESSSYQEHLTDSLCQTDSSVIVWNDFDESTHSSDKFHLDSPIPDPPLFTLLH